MVSMLIDPDLSVADILDQHPEYVTVLVGFGFKPLASALMRNTMAKHISLRQACKRRNVDLDAVLHDLQSIANQPSEPGHE